VNKTVAWLAIICSGLALSGCAAGGPGLPSIEPSNSVNSNPVGASTRGNFGGSQNRSATTKISGSGPLKVVKNLPPPPETKGGKIQPLSPSDEMDVVFFGIEKLNRTVRVDSTGMITMPLIGTVKAQGKTVRELEVELEKRYGRNYLQSPQITINVKEFVGQRVTVNGEVRQPGIYPLAPNATLLQALAQAKGFTQLGDPGKVYVFRQIKSTKYVAHYNVDRIRSGAQRDPRIYGNDVVVTFSSSAKVALQNLKDILGIARNASSLALIP